MFIGNNELRLNTATMCRIIEDYLKKEIGNYPKVTNITTDTKAASIVYVVSLEEHKEPAANASRT